MRSRWVVLLALALGLLSGCERIDTTEARDDLPTEFFEGDVDLGEQGTPLGEDITWDDDLRLRVDAVGVDSDDRGPWLTVTYRVENTGSSRRPIPQLGLACDESDGAGGVAPDDGTATPTQVRAKDSVEIEERLFLPGDLRVGEPIPACAGSLTIDVELSDATGATELLSPGWIVPDELRDELNARRPVDPLGGQQEISPGLLVDVAVESVGGDGGRAWLNVMVTYDSSASGEQPLEPPTLHCAQSDGVGEALRGDLTVAGSGGMRVELLIPPDSDGKALTTCRAPAHVQIGSGRWTLSDDELDYLNEELARDPARPYSWIATDDLFSSGYQVVVVPGATAAEALVALGPRRRRVSQENFWAIRVAEHERGVVLFTWGLVTEEQVVALSRLRGLAASYGNTVDGDDHILVARDGEVVRSFDPFLDHDYLKSKRLPEETGLDLENDTGPASWTLLERLTKVRITQEWLMDEDHPAYRTR